MFLFHKGYQYIIMSFLLRRIYIYSVTFSIHIFADWIQNRNATTQKQRRSLVSTLKPKPILIVITI